MSHHNLRLLVLMLTLCIIAAMMLLVLRVDRRETGSTGVNEPVIQNVASGGPITVGVILSGAAANFGWQDVTASGAKYAETTINGSRVIVYDDLDPAQDPGVTLEQVVSGMIERGARYVFVSPASVSNPGETPVTERFPDTVFIMNLATRDDVEALLPDLALTAAGTGPVAEASETETQTGTQAKNRGFPVLLVILGLIMLAATWALSSWWKGFRILPETRAGKKKRRAAGVHGKALAIEEIARGRATNFAVLGEAPPLVHELSTYVHGDTHFDESFAIELNGAFLGQCGMGPSEAVNRYDREKIAAFEVWLFDKNDIRTTTVVLLSEHAYDDESLKAKLTTKGELLLAETDAVTVLETKTLRVQARVLDMQYGFSDTLPQRSFFEHLVVEFAVWQK